MPSSVDGVPVVTSVIEATLSDDPAQPIGLADSGTNNLASRDDHSHALTLEKLGVQEHLGALAAAETVTLHAQAAAGSALNLSSGFTAICPARTVRIKRGGAGDPTVYSITGTRLGAVQSEDVNSDDANDVESTKAFDEITAITSDVDPNTTTDFVTGAGFGLGSAFSDLDAVGVDGVVESPDSSDAASGTVIPATEPDGSFEFVIRYRVEIVPT